MTATEVTGARRVFTGWKIVAAGALIWALQSMVWVQGYGNLAVELRNRFGLPGKIPDVFDDPRSAVDIGDNVIGHGFQVFIADRLPPFQHLQEKVGTHLDHIQWLIDFMGHPG